MFFFFFFFWLVAKIYLSGPGQSGSNIVAWFCGMVDFHYVSWQHNFDSF